MLTSINALSIFCLNPTIINQTQRLEFSCRNAGFPPQLSYPIRNFIPIRDTHKQRLAVCAASSDLEDVKASSFCNGDVAITTVETGNGDKLKIQVEVAGTRTQAIFDYVFDRMVAAAQPIPGFRRVKGGKTPNIPRDILMEVLGTSKVYKEVIKKVINSTVAEYVEKGGLKVTKDLRIEESYEDLEEAFEAGEVFSFTAIIKLQKH